MLVKTPFPRWLFTTPKLLPATGTGTSLKPIRPPHLLLAALTFPLLLLPEIRQVIKLLLQKLIF